MAETASAADALTPAVADYLQRLAAAEGAELSATGAQALAGAAVVDGQLSIRRAVQKLEQHLA